MLSLGVAQSISMLVAYYRGKHDKVKLKDTLKYGLISVTIMQVLVSILMFGIEPYIFAGYGIPGDGNA
jgi:Na+-driven multidrug efflux pump